LTTILNFTYNHRRLKVNFPNSSKMTEIRVLETIFREYPSFRRGIVVAKEIRNHGSSLELEAMLNQVIVEAAKKPIDSKTDPRTGVWNEAHRKFDSNPNKFPPAHCALLKRVQKTGTPIPFINKVVAIMNYNSIRDITPVGGDDVVRAAGSLELCYADGSETFTPLGKPEVSEHPVPGEVIYVVPESKEVMCRRWNWRNGHQTRITEDTEAIVMNIDGLGDESEARALATRDRVASMLEEYCQADIITTLLSPSQPAYQFNL
jgi:DNA/RNA-binding domain of Phe-tRNA-synthetase-like protein